MAAMTTALRKNILALFALGLAVLLYFLYLALFPTSTSSTPPLDPLSLWSLPPPNASHPLSGYPLLNQSLLHHSTLFTASPPSTPTSPGTYSHHPHILTVNSSSPLLLVSFSNGLIDEDADGQRVLYFTSPDAASTWSTPTELFPPALNATQSPTRYDTTKVQRAMCSEGFVQMAGGRTFAMAELYGQSEVGGIPREGAGLKATGYGRVAREVNSTDGRLIGAPCWLQRSRFVSALAGTPYDPAVMRDCDDAEDLVPLLAQAPNQPAWAWSLMSANHHVHARNDTTDVGEPTRGFVFNATSTCRFWRLLSPTVNRTLYIECSNSSSTPDPTYSAWFNGTDESAKAWYGPYASIVPTNIPDAGSKPFFGAFPPSSGNDRSTYLSWRNPANLTHYLVHNPQPRADDLRYPLVVSTSIDNSTFNATAALHPSPPPALRYPGLYKNPGYQYPSASLRTLPSINGTSEDVLYVVYSVNKEDVGLTWVRVRDLPRGVGAMDGGGGGGGGSGDTFGKGFVFFVLCVVALVVVAGLVWTLVWAPATRVTGEEVGVGKGGSEVGWVVDKRQPLVAARTAEEEEYEEGEEDEEEDEEGEYEDEEEDEEEEDEVEEKNGTAVVTSADVAHYVAAPRTAPPARFKAAV